MTAELLGKHGRPWCRRMVPQVAQLPPLAPPRPQELNKHRVEPFRSVDAARARGFVAAADMEVSE